MTREECLKKAINIVCNGREQEYGKPEDNFKTIANLWNTYLGTDKIKASDVGIMMALLKIARIKTGNYKDDSYIDCAGYIACASELCK